MLFNQLKTTKTSTVWLTMLGSTFTNYIALPSINTHFYKSSTTCMRIRHGRCGSRSLSEYDYQYSTELTAVSATADASSARASKVDVKQNVPSLLPFHGEGVLSNESASFNCAADFCLLRCAYEQDRIASALESHVDHLYCGIFILVQGKQPVNNVQRSMFFNHFVTLPLVLFGC